MPEKKSDDIRSILLKKHARRLNGEQHQETPFFFQECNALFFCFVPALVKGEKQRESATVIQFPVRARANDPAGRDDPRYLDKRYQIMITAAESCDLDLIDELYEVIRWR